MAAKIAPSPSIPNAIELGSGFVVTFQPITSIARMSFEEKSISSPCETAGSMMPMPKPSFQWLACRPSPNVRPVEKVVSEVAPPSMEKYLFRLSAVQSTTPLA